MSTTEQPKDAAPAAPAGEPWENAVVVVDDAPYDEFEAAVADEILRLQRDMARLDAEEKRLDSDEQENKALGEQLERDNEALKQVEDVYNAVHQVWTDRKTEVDVFGIDFFGEALSGVEGLELGAASSILSHVWTSCLAEHFAALTENRVAQPRSSSADVIAEVKALLDKHNADVAEFASFTQQSQAGSEKSSLDNANFLNDLQEKVISESERLQAVRMEYLPKLQEQSFHLRRGSHKKHSIVDLKPSDQAIDRRREKLKLAQLSELVANSTPEVLALEREVKQLEKELKVLNARRNTVSDDLQKQVDTAKQEAEEATWELESVLIEQEQARSLRGDIVAQTSKARKAKADGTLN